VQVAPLVGKQLESVRLADARLNIWEGSVRSSKTISSLVAWLQFVRHGPAGNLIMTGKTERTLKRNIIDPLTEMLGSRRCRHVVGSGELWLLGRRVYLAGANNELSQEKIRGLSLVGAYCDEISTVPESFFTMLLSRLSAEGARFYGSSNPDSPAHWLKRDFLDRPAVWLNHAGEVLRGAGDEFLDLARFSFRLADNPHLPAAYISSLEREYVGLWRKRFIEGLWVAAEGAVFDMWDDERHVIDILPPIQRWLTLAADYGTANPLHALLIGLGVDGCLYVTAEYRYESRKAHRQLTDAEYSQRIRDWLLSVPIPGSQLTGPVPQYWVIDPSAASFVTQLRRDGVNPVGANNDVLDGIRLVSTLLAAGKLKVHRSCQALITELPAYVWDDKAALAGEDKPVKIDDHGVDALRYGVMTTRALWQQVIPLATPSPGADRWPAAV
jgi:PBSX family phage terminase large subunit